MKKPKPKCTIKNISNGVTIAVWDSRQGLNGTFFYKTIQEALVHMWDELYPNSASSTLEFIKGQINYGS